MPVGEFGGVPAITPTSAMGRWLKRFGATSSWQGGTPDIKELDRWYDFLKARNVGADRHTPQVYFFNAKAELAMRSTDFPSAEAIARTLGTMAQATMSSTQHSPFYISRIS